MIDGECPKKRLYWLLTREHFLLAGFEKHYQRSNVFLDDVSLSDSYAFSMFRFVKDTFYCAELDNELASLPDSLQSTNPNQFIDYLATIFLENDDQPAYV